MKASLYKRPDKTFFVDSHRRPRSTDTPATKQPEPSKPIIVNGGTDCFVTPPEVAARMAEYANIESGQKIGDFSAGTGNLLQAIIETGEEVDLYGNELNYTLFESLENRFSQQKITLTQGDFLEVEGIKLDILILNPPYSRRQSYKHIKHAKTLLSDNGVIIALVPSNFEIDGMYTIEDLPRDTFQNTSISTKIIEIEV